MTNSHDDRHDATEDVQSVTPKDSAEEVESKVLGINEVTGSPTEEAADAKAAPTRQGDDSDAS